TIDLSGLKNNDDCNLNDKEATIEEFKQLKKLGVTNIIDVTNYGMKPNPLYVQEVALAANINIIQGCGFYQERFFDDYIKNASVEQLANHMIKEINNGIGNTNIKASFIGEIGTSKDGMTINEAKVFKAATIAALKTGVVISTHTTLGLQGRQHVAFFQEANFPLDRVVLGHVDLTGDLAYILELLASGVYIEFDTIGKENYLLDEIRIDMLKAIEQAGYEDKVMLSMDITRKSSLKKYGGLGYSYLLDTFIPKCLQNGISQSFIDKMLCDNPYQLFTKEQI
ncbi:MAG: phosphotriesterase family protein, partial [Bacilli bacterium]